MSCCNQCVGVEKMFNDRVARRDLKDYLRKGPDDTTRILLDALTRYDLQGATLLDIGGGVGVVQHELLHEGVAEAINVDASRAYSQVAQEEASRRGFRDRMTYHHGNFVDLADDVDAADIVTLVRVICCYDDMHSLVRLSAQHARRYYALVYPRDRWLMRIAAWFFSLGMQIMRNPFRIFIHPTPEVNALIEAAGLRQVMHRNAGFWQVAVYERSA